MNARALLIASLLVSGSAAAATEFEPKLSFAAPAEGGRSVALTFDACSGAVDRRILDALVESEARSTIFVTGRWLKKNADAFAVMKARPDLFEIENHGAHHVAAVTDATEVFGQKAAGSIEGVRAEIAGGAAAIEKAGAPRPRWFRGATARYSRDALDEIAAEGLRVAGYSLNADMGASLPASSVAKRIAAAKSGDVVIAHINQPTHPSGEGVAEGIRALKAAGVTFVRLDDVAATVRSDDGQPLLSAHREVGHQLHVQRDDHHGDQGGDGRHPAGGDELSHLRAAGGEPDQRDYGERKLEAEHDLAQHK